MRALVARLRGFFVRKQWRDTDALPKRLRGVLTPPERARFERTKLKASHLAKRWAAKEAFAKAIGTGIHAPFTWQSITVTRDRMGAPGIEPGAGMAQYLASRGVKRSFVTLTDDAGIAVAFVVLEG